MIRYVSASGLRRSRIDAMHAGDEVSVGYQPAALGSSLSEWISDRWMYLDPVSHSPDMCSAMCQTER